MLICCYFQQPNQYFSILYKDVSLIKQSFNLTVDGALYILLYNGLGHFKLKLMTKNYSCWLTFITIYKNKCIHLHKLNFH